jgi:hypothetical protein
VGIVVDQKFSDVDQSGDDTVATVPDLTPTCGEAEFAEEINAMVADEAPKLFAIVQELGERADAVIAAWGMAFDDCAELIGADGGSRMSLESPETARWLFSRRENITAHIIWVSQEVT